MLKQTSIVSAYQYVVSQAHSFKLKLLQRSNELEQRLSALELSISEAGIQRDNAITQRQQLRCEVRHLASANAQLLQAQDHLFHDFQVKCTLSILIFISHSHV